MVQGQVLTVLQFIFKGACITKQPRKLINQMFIHRNLYQTLFYLKMSNILGSKEKPSSNIFENISECIKYVKIPIFIYNITNLVSNKELKFKYSFSSKTISKIAFYKNISSKKVHGAQIINHFQRTHMQTISLRNDEKSGYLHIAKKLQILKQSLNLV